MYGRVNAVIKHKNIPPKLVHADYDKKFVEASVATLNSILTANNINVDSAKPFEKTMRLASNNTPKNYLQNIVRAFEDIIKSGRIENKAAESILLRYQTPLIRLAASIGGYSSFTDLFDRIKTGGTGLTNQEIVNLVKAFQEASEDKFQELSENLNIKKRELQEVGGLPITLVESFKKTYDSEVPLKRIEAGYEITTYIHNKTPVYSFEGLIVGGVETLGEKTTSFTSLAGNNIRVDGTTISGSIGASFTEEISNSVLSSEDLVKELVDIRNSKITFDIEFDREFDIYANKYVQKETLKDCLFLDLTFSRNSKNLHSYVVSFSVVPITKGSIQKVTEKFTGTKTGDGNKTLPEKYQKQFVLKKLILPSEQLSNYQKFTAALGTGLSVEKSLSLSQYKGTI